MVALVGKTGKDAECEMRPCVKKPEENSSPKKSKKKNPTPIFVDRQWGIEESGEIVRRLIIILDRYKSRVEVQSTISDISDISDRIPVCHQVGGIVANKL